MSSAETPLAPVIWITGASSGIGEALARHFAARGARLILSSRRRDVLEAVAAGCGCATPPLVLPFDLTKSATFGPAVAEVIKHFGRIDILVNCGGVTQRALALETTEAVEREIMEIDYFGTILLTKAVLPRMIAQGSGKIVTISSVMGYVGTPRRTAYAAAKHALHGWFDSLREEVRASGVSVLLVCPGYVQTNMSINALSGDGTANGVMENRTARGMTPDHCACAVLLAIDSDREEVFVGGYEVWATRLKRWFPRMFSRILRRGVARGVVS